MEVLFASLKLLLSIFLLSAAVFIDARILTAENQIAENQIEEEAAMIPSDDNKSGKTKQEFVRPSDEELRKQLSPEQYKVACQDGTEPPFRNAYWDHKEPGIYVDVISGEPLFSSTDKFDSGTGWPSFTKPIEETNVIEKSDTSHGMVRTEVRSKSGNAHLGHVFDDGPGADGNRYCINSASLRFVPLDKLEQEGYGKYKVLFDGK